MIWLFLLSICAPMTFSKALPPLPTIPSLNQHIPVANATENLLPDAAHPNLTTWPPPPIRYLVQGNSYLIITYYEPEPTIDLAPVLASLQELKEKLNPAGSLPIDPIRGWAGGVEKNVVWIFQPTPPHVVIRALASKILDRLGDMMSEYGLASLGRVELERRGMIVGKMDFDILGSNVAA